MIGDIPTLCRGPGRDLRGCEMYTSDEIRIFDGGVWHAGAANVSGKGVWKLFVGLVPAIGQDQSVMLGSPGFFNQDRRQSHITHFRQS